MSTIVDGLFLSRSPRVYKGSIMSTIADSSLSWSRCLAVCRPLAGARLGTKMLYSWNVTEPLPPSM